MNKDLDQARTQFAYCSKERVTKMSEAFKRRYGRPVDVKTMSEKDFEGRRFAYGSKVIELYEQLRDGATQEVVVLMNDKKFSFSRYIDAEIFVVDHLFEE